MGASLAGVGGGNRRAPLSDAAQDALEDYWIECVEKKGRWSYAEPGRESVLRELVDAGYAVAAKGKPVELTERGRAEARSCIRRHRLAERLFADVLDIKGQMIERMGCHLEHILQREAVENICTLLGHPRFCPHDKPIPEGACCRDESRMPRKLIRPLTECEPGESGKIAYLKTDRDDEMHKLTAMGILPGLTVRLIRKRPRYQFKVGETQYAVDRQLASKIQIRFTK